MKLPKFIENIFYVKPFCKQVKNVCSKHNSLFFVYSNDDKDLSIFVIINYKMLEITRDYKEQKITTKIFSVSDEGLKDWTNRKSKVILLKGQADISSEKDLIEKITHQLSFQKKHIQLKSEESVQIMREIIHFEKEYYQENVIDVNFSMNLGRQNHWLD